MRVAITGGTGFLGSHIVARLAAAAHHPVILSRDPPSQAYLSAVCAECDYDVELLHGDYRNIAAILERVAPDVVVHVAAQSRALDESRDLRGIIDANVTFGAQLLDAMAQVGCGHFVNCGSSWQTDENGGYHPADLYAASKQAFEDLLLHYCLDGLRAITLRVFDSFGPHDRRGKVVDLLIDAALGGDVLDMSPGEQGIDLVDVRDVADAFSVACRRLPGLPAGSHEVYGVQSASVLSIRDLAAVVGEVVGRSARVNWGSRPYRRREVVTPCQVLPRLPGWTPAIPLRTTVSDMVRQRRGG